MAVVRPKPPIPPKPKIMTLTDEDLNRYLNNKEFLDILRDFDLTSPSELKDASLSEIQDKMNKASKEITEQAKKKKTQNNANFKTIGGIPIASSKSKNPRSDTIKVIKYHNTLAYYIYNLSLLKEYKQKSGSGIFYFNNPTQLLNRLELLGGLILAGNNGVIPEFSQIAHLLNKMNVL